MYNPRFIPELGTIEELRQWLNEEFKTLSQSLTETTELELRASKHEPQRPREGMIVHADGTAWNPGDGPGTYRYEGGSWVRILGASDIAGFATTPVDNTQLSDMAETTIKGREVGVGTGAPEDLTATQATAILNAFTSALKGLAPASGGGTANFLRADGSWAAAGSGIVLQCLQTTYTANTNLTTALPIDDTTPTISEGAEALSLSITPASTSSRILCFACLWGSSSVPMAVALFRGSTCINAASTVQGGSTVGVTFPPLVTLDSPASASAQTYSVRVGTNAGTAMRLNGTTTARQFGGAAACTLTLVELA